MVWSLWWAHRESRPPPRRHQYLKGGHEEPWLVRWLYETHPPHVLTASMNSIYKPNTPKPIGADVEETDTHNLLLLSGWIGREFGLSVFNSQYMQRQIQEEVWGGGRPPLGTRVPFLRPRVPFSSRCSFLLAKSPQKVLFPRGAAFKRSLTSFPFSRNPGSTPDMYVPRGAA